MFFFGPNLLRKVANMQKSNVLKKLYLAYFFKSDYKIASFQKTENITLSVFEKRLTWCFRIFDNLIFFNNFWKNTQGIVFSTHYIFGRNNNLRGLKGILERSGWLERCGGLECFGWPTLSILLCRQVRISVPIFKLV